MELTNLGVTPAREYSITVADEKVVVNGNEGVVSGLQRILGAKGITSFTLIVDGVTLTTSDSLYEDEAELTFAEAGDVVVNRNVKGGKE